MSRRFSTASGLNMHGMSSRMFSRMSMRMPSRMSTRTFSQQRMSTTSLGAMSTATLQRRRSMRLRRPTPSQIFHMICREIMNRKFEPDDRHDIRSKDPSYSNFRVPYEMHCAERRRQSKHKYERQFQREIRKLVGVQPNACEAANLQLLLSVTKNWPPLHNQRQLICREHCMLAPVEKNRLRYLMEHEILEMTDAGRK